MPSQELDCTECGGLFNFNMSFQRDGNYRIICPHCSHEHYRVVRDGKVTGDRWESSSMPWQNVRARSVPKAPVRRPKRARLVSRRPTQSMQTMTLNGPLRITQGTAINNVHFVLSHAMTTNANSTNISISHINTTAA